MKFSHTANIALFSLIVGLADVANAQAYKLTDLGTLGGQKSHATGLNDSGEIIGDSRLSSGSSNIHAAFWGHDGSHDLGTLGGIDSQASAINSRGQVVGSSALAGNDWHATLWNGSAIIDLNSVFGSDSQGFFYLSSAQGINDRGQIVGYGLSQDGSDHAFLLTPVPEPETYVMLLAGLGLLGMMVRRQPKQGL